MAATAEAPIYGDILEAIFSHVPLIHLVPAYHVSRAWNHAVSSSLAHVNPIKPWLTILTQSKRDPHVTATYAYDPRSRVWIEMNLQPSIEHASAVQSSQSTLLYTLTPAGFAFTDSEGAFRVSWHNAPAPSVWRTDPVVARVGNRVVVAGGACDFEDDLHAVEVYDMEARAWNTSQSMPELLKGSAGSTWLSVAVVGDKMLVTEKKSGVTFSFDPFSDTWNGPYDLRPDQNVFYCLTGILAGKLTVAGVMSGAENSKRVKLWSVEGELGSGSGFWFEEVGEMPNEMAEKVMRGWDFGSVVVTWVGNFAYVMNPVKPEEVVVCEVGARCEWWSVRNVAAGDLTKRMVVSGGGVSLQEVQRAVVTENPRFCMKLV
ncbi:F-box/kelch-repeat protein At1g23390 [Arachis duranensis]|uniref:F-box/kelch-repeat protein At1g23390 n=1 Tax=Arachis duranensis TaxID=130453 RepID=A0A6P4DAL7_ARADU|nr:F-box/kelch-repeat protein At1g23390 [Arachis duranensis]XP_057761434.1 F-box/kelch-repeat protein At1g23390-like [Arachis stenosperma]